MDAYAPDGPVTALAAVAVLLALVVSGGAIARSRARAAAAALAWSLLVAGLVAMERVCHDAPAGFRMLALIAAVLLAMKAVVAAAARREGMRAPAAREWLAFACGWPGMRPSLFAGLGGARRPDIAAHARRGVLSLLGGAFLIAAAWAVGSRAGGALLATAALMVGLSLALHFGLFELLAATWRAAGVDCRSLFRSPLGSGSLREFWSRRWNIAFSEMTAVAVHRPLARRLGRRAALLASFLFSGLLHETAISLPVRAGFGLPTLYFALQGTAVLLEERLGRSGSGLPGWARRPWTALWLLAPLPLLFHPPFVRGVLWPLVGIGVGVSAR